MRLTSRGQVFGVPKRVTITGVGEKGAPDLRIECAMVDGQPSVREVHLIATAEGRDVRDSDLADIALDKMALRAFLDHAMSLTTTTEGGWTGGPIGDEQSHWRAVDALTTAQKSPRGPSMDELRRVAEVYNAHVSTAPSTAVANLLGYSTRTAHRRIQQAEQAGLLPPAPSRGKRRTNG